MGAPLPVQKLEFLKDLSGSLLYIIATLPAGYPAIKFFHQGTYNGILNFQLANRFAFSIVPPSSQVIPHTEHPTAYNNRKSFLIKFLDAHQLTSERWSGSVNTPSQITLGSSSIRSLSIASSHGTPEIFPSNGSISDSSSIGSPILSPNASIFKTETKYPKYKFEDEKGALEIGVILTLALH